MQVDERRIEAVDDLLRDVEEAGAARAAQELAAGAGQQVAADLLHVERHLADGLAGVEQVGDAMAARDLADLLGRVDQSALGRDVRDGDEPGLRTDQALQGIEVDLAAAVARRHVDLQPAALGLMQEGEEVADILRFDREDAVALLQRQGIERHVPGARGVLDIGDLGPVAVQQRGEGVVEILQRRLGLVLRVVAADGLLQRQVIQHGLIDRRRHQGGAGVVEVDQLFAGRRVRAQAGDVESHCGSLKSLCIRCGHSLIRHGKAWLCHPRVSLGKTPTLQSNSWMPRPSLGMTENVGSSALIIRHAARLARPIMPPMAIRTPPVARLMVLRAR